MTGESPRSRISERSSVPADARMPAPHSHDAFEETIFGLAGRTTYTVGGETIEVDPGDSICIPRGVVHAFANHGSSEARFLAMGEVMRRHGLTPA